MRFTAFYLFLLCLVCGPSGCGQNTADRVPVAGTVLIDGQPLTSGNIRFVPAVGRPASSAIMSDGTFELAADSVNRVSEVGVTPGTYRVQVSSSKIVDDQTVQWNAPEKYADFRTSGLDITIEKPTHDLLIELTWADSQRSDAAVGSAQASDTAPGDGNSTSPEADGDSTHSVDEEPES